MPTAKQPSKTLEGLRRELGSLLVHSDCVTPPDGVSTGWKPLDQFLIWKGYPKAAVSLMIRDAGGATTLWQRSAAQLTQKGQWAAWVDGPTATLNPWSLRQGGVNLAKMLSISAPKNERQALWVLQELMSLCLFELIGCDFGPHALKEGQVRQLKKLALRYQTALVLLTDQRQAVRSSFYSLILEFRKDNVLIHRALHRPTPHLLERKELYADTLPQLAAGNQAFGGRELSHLQPTSALSSSGLGVSGHHLHI